MKSNLLGSLALVALTSFSAFGIVRPGWERPVKTAQLEQIEGDGRYPRPTELTMNKQDGALNATSFTLVEDTGLRCITTPCPSSKTTQFRVTQANTLRNGSVRYLATSVPRVLIMGIIAPGPGSKARAIEVLARDEKLVRTYGDAARRRALDQFSADAAADGVEAVYRDLLQARSIAAPARSASTKSNDTR